MISRIAAFVLPLLVATPAWAVTWTPGGNGSVFANGVQLGSVMLDPTPGSGTNVVLVDYPPSLAANACSGVANVVNIPNDPYDSSKHDLMVATLLLARAMNRTVFIQMYDSGPNVCKIHSIRF